MAALTWREIVLHRLALQAIRIHHRDSTHMHEKVAALHAQFTDLEAAVTAAKARETGLVDINQKQAADLATAQANALDADSLAVLGDLSARVGAMQASLDGPA